ncbi:hypothetical protein [Haloarchaeobius sp. HRN-SO-5]|uniref:hypothetical protein n=1 Tax=Haloarchaeobius sp. HRN-SO-5 TaxID=3446118 RepID=UPI003EBBA9AA
MSDDNPTRPCLYCGEFHRFLSGSHFKREDHFGEREAAFSKYKQWVADTYDIDPQDPILTEPGELTGVHKWKQNRDRFPNWRSKTEL